MKTENSLENQADGEPREFPGINHEQTAALRDIFRNFERIESATMFGSRVTGGHKPSSDLDIALSVSNPRTFHLSDMQERICPMILGRTGLDVHLKVVEDIHNPDLRHSIESNGVIIYQKGR